MTTKHSWFRVAFMAAVMTAGGAQVRGVQQPDDLSADALLGAALHQEEVEGNLEAAIATYQELLARPGTSPALAANALVRMAACYETLGRPEARGAYEQVLRDYADQAEPVAAARARLAALEVEATQPSAALHTELLWTTDRGVSAQGGVSQDGSLMTYVDWSDLGNLAIHDFATGESRRLTHTADNGSLFADNSRISPDGEQVVYGWCCTGSGDGRTELRLLSLEGDQRAPRTVWSPADGNSASVQDWFPSGDRVVAVVSGSYQNPGTQQIITVSTDDGQVQQILSVEWGRNLPVRVSPDGRYLAYSRAASREVPAHDIFLVAVDGSSESTVVQHGADDRLVGWGQGGTQLLFNSDRTGQSGLWAQRVQDAQPVGEPRLLVPNVRAGGGAANFMGLTRDGTLHYVVNINERRLKTAELDLTTGKFLRQPVDAVERFLGRNHWPTFSPDGETFAYVSTRPGGTTPIVFRSLKTGEERDLLPLGLQGVERLRWSPGGPITVIGRDDRGRRGRFVVDVATGQTRPLGEPEEPAGFLTPDGTEGILTPDGMQILHRASGEQTDSLYSYRVADGSVHALSGDFQASSGGYVSGGNFFLSPDGQWIATIRRRTNEFVGREIRLHGVAGGDGRVLATTGDDERFGRWVTWTPDSSALVVLKQEPQAGEGMRLWVVPVDGSAPVATELVYVPRAGGTPGLIIHPDGTRIFYHEGNSSIQFLALHNLGLDQADVTLWRRPLGLRSQG